jgi:DNA-binding SARP family transcriptional activator
VAAAVPAAIPSGMAVGEDTPVPLRFRVLGPVVARERAGQLALGAPKQRSVLAALLLNANRVVSAERLFALVWGEDPPPSVRGRLRVHISELRALLGRDTIVRAGAGYRLDLRPGELDLLVFDLAVTAARDTLHRGNATEAAERLRAALALWTGPALAGTTPALSERERPPLEERRVAALEELFEAELAARRHARVVAELRRACADHPLRERFRGQLMLALHRCGRSPEALAVYADTRRRLAEELGIPPGQDLRALQVRILDDQDTTSNPSTTPNGRDAAPAATKAGTAPPVPELDIPNTVAALPHGAAHGPLP